MTWADAGVTAVVVIVIPVSVYVFNRLNNHGERIIKVETKLDDLGADVREIKGETKTQTRMLDRVMGKLGIGMDRDETGIPR